FGRGQQPTTRLCTAVDIKQTASFAGHGKNRRLKTISKVIDNDPLINTELFKLARWISNYYICPLGQVLTAIVPAAVKKGAGVKKQKLIYLAPDCQQAIDQLRGKKQKQLVEFLQTKNATDPNSAIVSQTLLEEVSCTNAPIKKLAQNQIIKIIQKTVLKSLPAIPDEAILKTEKVTLNSDQQAALTHITNQIDSNKFAVTLLHGVTDSGKTEVYIRAIEAVLKKGKTAIILLPEIALTAQTVQRFSLRFEKIAVMHSALTAAQRNVQWQKIRSRQADVVIGARSAIFAPIPNLGLIVVDEEHEPSYKQDTQPRYHGRDVAIKRAQLTEAHCILGSATPALEMLTNCQRKKHFSLVTLPNRVLNVSMPQMKLIDMRDSYTTNHGGSLISPQLAKNLKDILAKNEQAILLLNRRGYSNFVFCPSCKHTLHCRNCDVTLTFHKKKLPQHDQRPTVTGKHMNFGYAQCHYCGSQTLVPRKCPVCDKKMTMIGIGSQRLEEQLAEDFPAARVARIDSDSMQGGNYYKLLRQFGKGQIDILAGTQMLAKGLHFPNVTLVGIISADTSLSLPDFRANERTFQLICQVAGRAGRSEKKGTVYIQSFMPDQPAIQFALANDYQGFTQEELKHRNICNLPPYWRLAVIVLRSMDHEKLTVASQAMRDRIDAIAMTSQLNVTVRGPMPAAIARIQRFHRMQIIIQSPDAATMQKFFTQLRSSGPIRPNVKIAIDIDPVNLL
ncbi:MAG: replication restart helicase PriA, partial [Planctomycetota bacterium]